MIKWIIIAIVAAPVIAVVYFVVQAFIPEFERELYVRESATLAECLPSPTPSQFTTGVEDCSFLRSEINLAPGRIRTATARFCSLASDPLTGELTDVCTDLNNDRILERSDGAGWYLDLPLNREYSNLELHYDALRDDLIFGAATRALYTILIIGIFGAITGIVVLVMLGKIRKALGETR